MVYSAPPTLQRVFTRPAEYANLHPNDMAAWWRVGRAERTQPVDSANSEPDARVARAARPRWPRFAGRPFCLALADPLPYAQV